MSSFALGLLGFLFGWGFCSASLIWYRPDLLKYVLDPGWVRFSDRINALRSTARRHALDNEASAFSKTRYRTVQRWYGASVFAVAAFLAVIEILQDFRSSSAAAIEDVVTEPRLATLLLAAVVGFGARLYRREIVSGIDALWKIALVSGNDPKKSRADTGADDKSGRNTAINYVDSRFPWYVELGILISIVIVVVVWVNPQLLKNLTSFKAGGVEAHFATATGNATVQSGLIVAVDPARKTTTHAWATFDFPHEGDERFGTYTDKDDKDSLNNAKLFFETYLQRLFKYRNGLYDLKHPMLFEQNHNLTRPTADFSTLILLHGTDTDYVKSQLTTAWASACADISRIDAKTCEISDEQSRKILQQKEWDPYIKQGVADLLFVLEKRKEQEDFLVAATSDADGNENICPKGCKTAGQLSLMYDVVLAKVRSQRPWPFAEMLKELSKALDGIDGVIDRNASAQAGAHEHPSPYETTDRVFHRNRFIDLTLGLELFYQRALQGQHFTPQQTQVWRDWLAETRGVVELVRDDIVAWPPPFSEETRKAWLRAKSEIIEEPATIEDAYVGIALSLALIGSSDGDVSDRDCVAARALLVRADDALPNYFALAKLDEDDKGTYKGFLEQVKLAIEGRCKPQ